MRAAAVLLLALVCLAAGRDDFLDAMMSHQSATLASIGAGVPEESVARAAEERFVLFRVAFFFVCPFLCARALVASPLGCGLHLSRVVLPSLPETPFV